MNRNRTYFTPCAGLPFALHPNSAKTKKLNQKLVCRELDLGFNAVTLFHFSSVFVVLCFFSRIRLWLRI